MRTLVILVTFNPEEYMKYVYHNIETIFSLDENTDILIVDNSTIKQDVLDLIDKYKAKTKFSYIINTNNNGPGSGFNQGIKYALDHQYDYCYFVDQDSFINQKTIINLVRCAENINDFSFLASKVLSETDDRILNYFSVRMNKHMSFYFVKDTEYKNEMIEINAAGYTGILLNLKIIQHNKLFIDESMFIAYDDYDFTYRLSRVNKGYVVTNSSITHPNKRTRFNSRIFQFLFNYIRQIPYGNDMRKDKAAQNYIYLIFRYGGKFSKIVKLVIIPNMMFLFSRRIFKKYRNMVGTIEKVGGLE